MSFSNSIFWMRSQSLVLKSGTHRSTGLQNRCFWGPRRLACTFDCHPFGASWRNLAALVAGRRKTSRWLIGFHLLPVGLQYPIDFTIFTYGAAGLFRSPHLMTTKELNKTKQQQSLRNRHRGTGTVEQWGKVHYEPWNWTAIRLYAWVGDNYAIRYINRLDLYIHYIHYIHTYWYNIYT